MTHRRWLSAALAQSAEPLPAPLPWARGARRAKGMSR